MSALGQKGTFAECPEWVESGHHGIVRNGWKADINRGCGTIASMSRLLLLAHILLFASPALAVPVSGEPSQSFVQAPTSSQPFVKEASLADPFPDESAVKGDRSEGRDRWPIRAANPRFNGMLFIAQSKARC